MRSVVVWTFRTNAPQMKRQRMEQQPPTASAAHRLWSNAAVIGAILDWLPYEGSQCLPCVSKTFDQGFRCGVRPKTLELEFTAGGLRCRDPSDDVLASVTKLCISEPMLGPAADHILQPWLTQQLRKCQTLQSLSTYRLARWHESFVLPSSLATLSIAATSALDAASLTAIARQCPQLLSLDCRLGSLPPGTLTKAFASHALQHVALECQTDFGSDLLVFARPELQTVTVTITGMYVMNADTPFALATFLAKSTRLQRVHMNYNDANDVREALVRLPSLPCATTLEHLGIALHTTVILTQDQWEALHIACSRLEAFPTPQCPEGAVLKFSDCAWEALAESAPKRRLKWLMWPCAPALPTAEQRARILAGRDWYPEMKLTAWPIVALDFK
jgi:hypothetical protein